MNRFRVPNFQQHREGRLHKLRHGRNQSGAALVEAALVLPIMMMIVIGIVEFGLLYSSHSTTTASTRSGARLAATAYPQVSTLNSTARLNEARNIADAVSADLKVLNNAEPVGMTIYQVNMNSRDGAPHGGFPDQGLAGGCTSNCMRFTWNSATQRMNYVSGSWSNARVCGTNIDSIGVFVETTHDSITGLIGSGRHVKGHTVMRLEPVPSEQCP